MFMRQRLCFWIELSLWFGVKGFMFVSIRPWEPRFRGSEKFFLSPKCLRVLSPNLLDLDWRKSGLDGGWWSWFFDLSSNVLGVCGVSKSLKPRREGGELVGLRRDDCWFEGNLRGEGGDSRKLRLESLDVGVNNSELHSWPTSTSNEVSVTLKLSRFSSTIVLNKFWPLPGGENNVWTQSLTSKFKRERIPKDISIELLNQFWFPLKKIQHNNKPFSRYPKLW